MVTGELKSQIGERDHRARSPSASCRSRSPSRAVLGVRVARSSATRRTALDLAELERITVDTAGLDGVLVAAAASEAHGLGLFVRSLLGLDRAAAVEAHSGFRAGTTFTGNQLAFADLLVEQLTQRGVIDPRLLYEAPFTGVAPTGPEAIFTSVQVQALVHSLESISATAAAS
jgi:type I restriction enzyme R subunit